MPVYETGRVRADEHEKCKECDDGPAFTPEYQGARPHARFNFANGHPLPTARHGGTLGGEHRHIVATWRSSHGEKYNTIRASVAFNLDPRAALSVTPERRSLPRQANDAQSKLLPLYLMNQEDVNG